MSKADKPPDGDPEEARKRAEAILRQRAFGRELRAIYNQYVDEPVPPAFDELLDRLERGEDPSVAPGAPSDDDHTGKSGR